MIGDAYFQLRAQIGTSLFSLAKLARDLEAPESSLASLQELQNSLREPFRFATLGVAGAGKSSLLNTLFGREFAGDPAFHDCAVIFEHGAEPREQPLSDELLVAARPHIFLRDFTILDAPGFGSRAATSQVLERFLPTADVVLFVFSSTGDASAAWDFLASADRELRHRFIFLVQQSDAVEGDQLMNVVLGLHDRLRETLDERRPLFIVSAHARAGLEKLESYLDNEVIGSPARFQKLREICLGADDLLFQLGGQTRAASDHAEQKLKLAETHQLALNDAKDEALRGLDRDLWSLAQTFEAAQRRGGELLRRRITQSAIWSSKIAWRDSLHRELEERVRDGVTRNVQLAAEHCDTTLRAAWNALLADLQRCGSETLGPFPETSAEHAATLERAIAECDPPGVTTHAVIERFIATRPLLRLPALIFVLVALLAGAAWFTGILFGAALALLALAFVAVVSTPAVFCERLAATLRRTTAARRELILSRVETEIRAEIDRVIRDLRACLVAVAKNGRKERTDAQPMLNRIVQLAELFDRSIDEIEVYEARPAEVPENTLSAS